MAAYKAAEVARRLQDAGAGVTCVMTSSASKFITPLTLSALTGRPAHHDLFDESLWKMAHLSLSKKADAVVVAPCSANLVVKLANGNADDLLSALILACRIPVFLAPAMHEPMWTHPATKKNVAACRSYGYKFIGPVQGPLASGDSGWGRLEDPNKIVEAVASHLAKTPRRK